MTLDPSAFDTLYADHASAVYRSALGIVRDPDAAADVVQETFVRAYTATDEIVSPAAWLATVASGDRQSEEATSASSSPASEIDIKEGFTVKMTEMVPVATSPRFRWLHAALIPTMRDRRPRWGPGAEKLGVFLVVAVMLGACSAASSGASQGPLTSAPVSATPSGPVPSASADQVPTGPAPTAPATPSGPVPSASADLHLVTSVASTGSYACGTLTDGAFRCVIAVDYANIPAAPLDSVSGLGANVTAAALGDPSCVVLGDGSVQCWGFNTVGELGNGMTNPSNAVAGAQEVQGLGGKATQVVVGGGWSCALLDDGTVDCWGGNGGGQLGDGTLKNRSTAAPVRGLSGPATAIAASGVYGAEYTCALIEGGTVECWGFNQDGVFGSGQVRQVVPVTVRGLDGKATAIAAGSAHACALIQDGTVWCWGGNRLGELGDGTFTDRSTAVRVEMLPGRAVGVAVGDEHSCALLEGGSVECWGANDRGQLGTVEVNSRPLPTVVPGLGGAPTAIAASEYHTCALMPEGSVECWGFGSHGAVVPLNFSASADASTPAPAAQPCVRLLDGTCGVDGNKCFTSPSSGLDDGSPPDNVCAQIGDLPPGWALRYYQSPPYLFGGVVTAGHDFTVGEPNANWCDGGDLLRVIYTKVGWLKPDVSYELGVLKATLKDIFTLEADNAAKIGPWSGRYLTFKCQAASGGGTLAYFVGTDGTPNAIVIARLQGGAQDKTARSLLSTFRILGGNASLTKPY